MNGNNITKGFYDFSDSEDDDDNEDQIRVPPTRPLPKSSGPRPLPKSSGPRPLPKSSGPRPLPKSSGPRPLPKSSGPPPHPKSSGPPPHPKSSGPPPHPKSSSFEQDLPPKKPTLLSADEEQEGIFPPLPDEQLNCSNSSPHGTYEMDYEFLICEEQMVIPHFSEILNDDDDDDDDNEDSTEDAEKSEAGFEQPSTQKIVLGPDNAVSGIVGGICIDHDNKKTEKDTTQDLCATIPVGAAAISATIALDVKIEPKTPRTDNEVKEDSETLTGIVEKDEAKTEKDTTDDQTKLVYKVPIGSAAVAAAAAYATPIAIAAKVHEKQHVHIKDEPVVKVTAPLDPATQESDDTAGTAVVVMEPTSPFTIVLVNIKKAAEDHHIHCENRYLDDKRIPYVALSYRWGELDEQMVRATKDYNARITSFHLQDFFKLCQAMLHEPDLQHIDYVWVDAICVDQNNMEKRKATIYRMNEIYSEAAAIVAVPDLHASHLSAATTANSDVMDMIQEYRHYLYYLLVGTPEAKQQLIDMDHAWMDTLGVPSLDLPRQDLILATQQKNQQQQQKRGWKNTNNKKKNKKLKSDTTGIIQQMVTLMITPSSQDTTTRSIQTSSLSPDKEGHYQQISCRMMVQLQRFEWQQHLNQRQTDIIQSMDFLQSLMEDWSNRTWVISEYHIAKKNTGKLKFWYNQLSHHELHGHRFFEFDFKSPPLPSPPLDEDKNASMQHHHPYTSQIIDLTRNFMGSMRRRLTKRSVLEMMLETKATKNDDRFNAIIPLVTKYKHHIKDRHSTSSLGISDMLSVRLKLLEWVDIKDRLNLLYSECVPLPSAIPFLPTFATNLKEIKPGLMKLLNKNLSSCNFGIKKNDDHSVRLVRGAPDELWLCPRLCIVSKQRLSYTYRDGDDDDKFWHDLGIDPVNDKLDAVSIPLFIKDPAMITKNDEEDALWASDIQLIGSWEKNIWIRFPFCSNYKDGKIDPGRICITDQWLSDGFRIY